MGKSIPCIDDNIYVNDDGSMECCWLDPYIGDITEEEWHERGTALGIRRGCKYCCDKLEWRTKCREEGWNDKETVCEGAHPDWPGEVCQIYKVVDSSGSLIGYVAQYKLYKSLHELEFYGWELQYSYYHDGKKIYEEEGPLSWGCGDYKCPANSEHGKWQPEARHAVCCKDSKPPEVYDSYAGNCGFIRVTDTWTIWKWGVPHKDFLCKNCGYYDGDNHGFGNCTNKDVKPSPKGIVVNGEKTYIETKEKHSGARACERFLKKGSEEVMNKKQDNIENVAAPCPHNRGIIKEGKYWIRDCARDPMRHLRYESKNQAEALSKTCRGEEDFSMCRFYGEGKCFNARCPFHHSEVYVSEKCDLEEIVKTKPHLIQEYAKKVIERNILEYCPMPEKLRELLSRNPIICTTCENEGTGCVPNNPEAGMCAAYEKKGGEENKMNGLKEFKHNKIFERHGLTCATCRFLPPKGEHCNRIGNEARLAKPHLGICDWYHNNSTGEMGPAEFDYQYEGGYSSCPYKDFPYEEVRRIYYTNPDIKRPEMCDSCSNEIDGGCLPPKYVNDTSKSANESTDIVNAEPEKVIPFDYSTVDTETAEFLQEKAQRIIEIRIKSVLAVGKELAEARNRLANHKNGTFEKWVSSVGISDQTARNYINAYEYIGKNFANIENAEKIQPSLLFAISKPSAPKELQEKVLSGDITTHKQYKELEEKLRKAEERAERAVNQKFVAESKAIDAENKARKAEKDKSEALRAYERDLQALHQQLEQAKRNSDPAKVQELGEKISEYQQEIKNYQEQIGKLNLQLQEKNRQLKERPIEAQAVKVVEEKVIEKEVVPDEVALAIYDKVARLYEGLTRLTDKEIQVFAEQVDPDYFDDIVRDIDEATEVLAKIEHAARKAIESNPIHPADDPICACGTCSKSDPDYDAEKLENESLTWCPVYQRYVHTTDETCDEFESYLEGR